MRVRFVVVLCLLAGLTVPAPAGGEPRPTIDGQRSPNTLQRAWRALDLRPSQAVRYGVSGMVSGVRGAARFGVRLGSIAGHVSGLGSLGLTGHAAWQLVRARTAAERLEACRDLGTGMSGLGCMGYLAGPISLKVGLVGVGLQSTVGAFSLVRGLQLHDKPRIVLGALDLGAGLLFGASLLSCLDPYAMVAAVGLTAARVAYAKRHGIKSAVEKLRDRLMRRRQPTRDPPAHGDAPSTLDALRGTFDR